MDALGNPVRLELTGGQVHDVNQAAGLLDGITDSNIIADKGYDSNLVVEQLVGQSCRVVIPPRSNRKEQRTIDRALYKERHLVENFFQRIKRNRRIAMRFEKLALHFLSMVYFAAVLVWLA